MTAKLPHQGDNTAQARELAIVTVTAWLRLFVEPGQVTELRALKVRERSYRPMTVAGFYDPEHLADMAKEALSLTRRAEGVYFTLNPLNPALKGRCANRAVTAEDGFCAGDRDVLCRRWLLIDTDPVRPKGVSASEAEKARALEVGLAIRDCLRRRGWPEPVRGDSGNGGHLLYRADLPADDGGLLRRVLLALAARFNTPEVHLDATVFNPARICKLYGTLARKGDNIPERPHRQSLILEVPGCAEPRDVSAARILPVPPELLEALAAEARAEPKPTASASATAAGASNGQYRSRLKVGEWLAARGIEYTVKGLPDGRTAYLLRHCPFNPEHTGKDVAIFQGPDGKLGARCFHDSCGGNHWQEFKQKIGPPAPEHWDPPLQKRGGRRGRQGKPSATGSPGPGRNDQPPGGGAPAGSGADTGGDGGPPPDEPRGESGECDPGRPEIVITTDEHEVNAQAAEVLARDLSLYQRGGLLVRVVRDTSPAAGGIRRPFAPRIEPLPSALLRERLAANARWVTIRETQQGPQEFPARPPGWCVAAVHARGNWPGLRHLEAVIDYPVLRPDGTILERPGFDDATGLLLDFDGELPEVPPAPCYREAIAARDALLEVVADFPFEQGCHRAAWLAGLLTPLARFAFAGPAPLFLVDANVRGAGKGLLLDCISRIVSGERFTVATYTSDEDELRKRITSLALAGDRQVLFDNLEGRFGNATLDAALTAPSWEDRVLGVNRMMRAPLFVTWYATGNNVAVGADTARRVCHVRLESPEERPEERGDFAHPDLLAHVAANRPCLLGAALTILRAYAAAGRPQRELRPWGSFDGWSRLVRQAVVWVGLPDPGETRYLLQGQADVTAEAMSLLLCCWEQMDPERQGLTAAEVIDRLFRHPPDASPAWHAEMRAAVESLVGRGDSRALGNRLRSYRRRIFRGRFIDQAGTERRAARWVVRPASEFRRPAGKDSPNSQDSPPDAAGGGRPGESCESCESFPANGRAEGNAPFDDSELL
jgi:hypothetical protein